MTTPRLLITPGEPAGIGPDITLQAIQSPHAAQLIAVCDPVMLEERARLLQLPLTLVPVDFSQEATPHQPGILPIIPIACDIACTPGILDSRAAPYVLKTLEMATQLCLAKKAHGVVTGPVNKAAINAAGIAFSGHTEFFAEKSNTPLTVMLFVVDDLKVALATTHLALKDVPAAITAERLEAVLQILNRDLNTQFGIKAPTILVCGLNPHAGESGHLGREEIETMIPLLERLRTAGMNVIGPLPADTIFTPKQLAKADAVLAMYHDQALPLVKYLGFSHAVNMTLGLPFIRTSVDHGTALDIAGTCDADANSLLAAITLGTRLALQHRHR